MTYDPADSATTFALVEPEQGEAEHRVKLAVRTGRGIRSKYIVECRCGWSSALHWSPTQANESYAAHKAGASA